MVAQNTVRKYGIHQVFRFFQCIWLHRKRHQIQFFCWKKYVRNMLWAIILYKYHGIWLDFIYNDVLDILQVLDQIILVYSLITDHVTDNNRNLYGLIMFDVCHALLTYPLLKKVWNGESERWSDMEKYIERESEWKRKSMRERERQKERDYKFIQKHSLGLNRVPARTYIFACLNQMSYRCHN